MTITFALRRKLAARTTSSQYKKLTVAVALKCLAVLIAPASNLRYGRRFPFGFGGLCSALFFC
jgi:hypothetical protein